MPRPIEALIHTDALACNLRRAREAAPDARIWSVVKARGYGHGLDAVFQGLRATDGFALLDVADAARLRELDWRGPILLLEGAFDARDLEWCSRLGLAHVVHRDAQIDWLAAHKTEHAHVIWLKLNSGMNRLGFAPAALRQAYARLNALPQVEAVGLMTHFSDADGLRLGKEGIRHQMAVFADTTGDLAGERSLANSAGLLRHGQDAAVRGDWVRPGIMLYGSSPDYPQHGIDDWRLQPAMTLRTRVIAQQHLQPGDTVGYGSVYVAERAMRIGIAACGYADGYPRHAPGDNRQGTPVLVDGQRSRTVGRVSMDMLCVDLSDLPQSGVGSEVTLWGQAGEARLPIDEVAHAAGTVGYELMCALSPRVPVRVLHEPETAA